MKVTCVARGGHGRISKEIELAAMPFVGCAIEYQRDWALGTVEYVYILQDSVEVGIRAHVNAEELAELLKAGWRQ